MTGGVFSDVVRGNETKTVRVVEGQLLVCKGCCCGNVERGFPAVPIDTFKKEWKERGIRSRVHLTISGCLGPCAVANVVLLIYKNATVWFHSVNTDRDVAEVFDYIEHLMRLGRFVMPAGVLAGKVFQRYSADAVCELGNS